MSYEFLSRATEKLDDAGFGNMVLDDFTFPQVQEGTTANGTPYRLASFKDPREVQNVIFCDMPHSTHLKDANMLLRLATQQMAVGEDYAVVGVETYNPEDMRFNSEQRSRVSSGYFAPLSDRFFAAMDASGVQDDQNVIIYGYSKGADVGIQVAHDNQFSASRGLHNITVLGAFEPARTAHRSLAMIPVFATSGNDLWENVLATGSPALLEARDIPTDVEVLTKKDKKVHDKAVAKGVTAYTMADIAGNLALIRGFGHADSVEQLDEMNLRALAVGSEMSTVVGIMEDSHIVAKSARRRLAGMQTANLFEVVTLPDLDHSAADDLRRSAAFLLHTVSLAA